MDLLNDYGSSSSSDDEAEPQQNQNQQQQKTPVASFSNSTVDGPAAAETNNKNAKLQRARGKKILSLASVLPPEIFDRLTRGDDNDGDDSDSSSSDDDDTKKPAAIRTSAVPSSDDPGISSFLTDLKRTQPEHQTGTTNGKKAGAFTINDRKKPPPPSASSSERMGAAFLSSTVTTTTTSTASDGVRDIHGEKGVPVATTTTSATVQKDDTNSTSRPLLRPTIQAAPRISAAPPVVANKPPPAAVRTAEPEARPSTQQSVASTNVNKTKRRSRKEMERALRKGNITMLDADEFDTELTSADPNTYQLDASTAVHQDSAPSVRNVPTAMYDPSTGTTSTVVAGVKSSTRSSSGKNQINQLLSQAAHLERQRAERGSVMGTAAAAKSHRANAKRKYGW